MANPSIDKTRVRNLPANGVFTVNNIAPDGLGNVTITAGDVGALSNANDTNSIDLTKFGTDISADLVVDVNTDNLISVSPTGTFADKKAIAHSYDNATSGLTATTVQWAIDELGGVSTAIQTVSDTNSIDLTKTGVDVSADLKLDASTNNLLSVSGAGTFADKRAIGHTYDPTASGLTATNVQAAIDEVEWRVGTLETTKVGTVSDTNSIDLTKTGVDLTADVKIDPSANNLTSITASGVFSDERAIAHTYDNATSGLIATEVQAAIDELASGISPRIPFTPTLLTSTTSTPATLISAWYSQTATEIEMFIACTMPTFPGATEMLVISNLPANIAWYVNIQWNTFLSSSIHYLLDRRTSNTTSITISRYDSASLAANAELTARIIYQK